MSRWIIGSVIGAALAAGCLEGPDLEFDNPCDPQNNRCRPAKRDVPSLGDLAVFDALPADARARDAGLGGDGGAPDRALPDAGLGPDADPLALCDPERLCLEPVDDTTVAEAEPQTNFGGDPTLQATLDEQGRHRDIWLKWDLAPLFDVAPVAWAELRFVFDVDQPLGAPRMELVGVPTDWSEARLTWASRPAEFNGVAASMGGALNPGQINGYRERIGVGVAINEIIAQGGRFFALRVGWPRAAPIQASWVSRSVEDESVLRSPPLLVAMPICANDDLEPNDRLGEATPLIAGDRQDGRACPGEVDLFSVALEAGCELTANLWFVHTAGDLSIELLDSQGARIELVQTNSDNEQLTQTIDQTDTYYLRVAAVFGANTYTLATRLDCAPPPVDGGPPDANAPPDAGLPDVSQPDVSQPDVSQPDVSQRDAALPDLALPDPALPDSAR